MFSSGECGAGRVVGFSELSPHGRAPHSSRDESQRPPSSYNNAFFRLVKCNRVTKKWY